MYRGLRPFFTFFNILTHFLHTLFGMVQNMSKYIKGKMYNRDGVPPLVADPLPANSNTLLIHTLLVIVNIIVGCIDNTGSIQDQTKSTNW